MSTRRVKRFDELAQDLPPTRDLWPAISAAIEAEKAAERAAGAPRRRTFWMPAAGMAAAVALVAIGVLIGRGLTPELVVPPLTTTAHPGNPDVRPAALRDADYRKQRDALLVEVNNRLNAMPEPEREK